MGKPIIISDVNNLRVEIYLIGYSQQGESVILLMRDLADNAIVYSIVVDSYEEEDCNKLIDILNVNGIGASKLNVLCWSHPDIDHSNGMEKIVTNYCDKETKVLIPYGIESTDLIIDRDGYAQLIDQLFELGNQRNRNVYTVSCYEQQVSPIDDFDIKAEQFEIPVTMAALAPSNEYLAEKIHAKKSVQKNMLSIMLVLTIGPYKFLMSGDVENSMIVRMRESELINPTWIKIPHHSSPSSSKMLDVLGQNDIFQMFSATTVKTQANLPDTKIVDRYNELSECVHCTGTPSTNESPCYGIIKYVFDLYGEHDIHITCEGNAYKCA